MRRQLPVSSPVSLSALLHGVRSALIDDGASHSVAAEVGRLYEQPAVVLCDSGTSALVLAMRAAVRPGGAVAVPGYACPDLIAAATFAGVRVRLYDLDPVTLSADLASLERTLRRGVDAVIAVHLYGFPTDVIAMGQLAHAHGAALIEDAAQAAGSQLDGRRCGSFGDISILSFGRGKGTTAGRGGAALASDDAWALRLEQSAAHLATARPRGWGDLTRAAAQWIFGRPTLYALPATIPALHLGETLYHPAREPAPLSVAAAAILRMSLRADPHEVACRRRNAAHLERAIGGGDVTPIRPLPSAQPGYLRFPVIESAGREPVAELGITRGYPVALFDQPEARLCMHIDEREPLGARQLRDALFTLPVHSYVTPADLDGIARWLRPHPNE